MVIGGLVAERLRTRRTLSTTSVRKLFCAAGTYSLTHLFIHLFIFAFSALTLLVGRQEGHPEWWGAGVVVCLERGADLHMAQLMPLPLTVSCFSKIQIGFTFLVPAHMGSNGKGPLNECVCYLFIYLPKCSVHVQYPQ